MIQPTGRAVKIAPFFFFESIRLSPDGSLRQKPQLNFCNYAVTLRGYPEGQREVSPFRILIFLNK